MLNFEVIGFQAVNSCCQIGKRNVLNPPFLHVAFAFPTCGN